MTMEKVCFIEENVLVTHPVLSLYTHMYMHNINEL